MRYLHKHFLKDTEWWGEKTLQVMEETTGEIREWEGKSKRHLEENLGKIVRKKIKFYFFTKYIYFLKFLKRKWKSEKYRKEKGKSWKQKERKIMSVLDIGRKKIGEKKYME